MGIESFSVPHLTQQEVSGVNTVRQLNEQLRMRQLANAMNQMKMRQSQQQFPMEQRHRNLVNQLAELKRQEEAQRAPLAGRDLASQIDFRRANTRYYNSPAFQEKNLTTLGKHQVEAGAIPVVKHMIQQNPTGNANVPSLYDDMYGRPDQTTGSFIHASQQGQTPQTNIVTNQPQPSSTEDSDISSQGSESPAAQSKEQQAVNNVYDMARLKDISDTDLRKKVFYATNMDKTFQLINPNDLTRYSGPQGLASFAIDKAAALSGHPSDKFLAFKNATDNAKLLAKQIRQYYGDSIKKEVRKQLEDLTNPTSWLTSPKTAIARFNNFKNTMMNETKTARDMLRDPKAFTESGAKLIGKKPGSSSASNKKYDFSKDSTADLKARLKALGG